MGKKKREHIVFDLTRKPKKTVPIVSVNRKTKITKSLKGEEK